MNSSSTNTIISSSWINLFVFFQKNFWLAMVMLSVMRICHSVWSRDPHYTEPQCCPSLYRGSVLAPLVLSQRRGLTFDWNAFCLWYFHFLYVKGYKRRAQQLTRNTSGSLQHLTSAIIVLGVMAYYQVNLNRDKAVSPDLWNWPQTPSLKTPTQASAKSWIRHC